MHGPDTNQPIAELILGMGPDHFLRDVDLAGIRPPDSEGAEVGDGIRAGNGAVLQAFDAEALPQWLRRHKSAGGFAVDPHRTTARGPEQGRSVHRLELLDQVCME